MTIGLYYSPASPFVRKVMVCAHERGIADRIEKLDCAVSPVKRDMDVVRHNGTGKLPCVVLDDGTPLFDSRVIAMYFDAQGVSGEALYPQGASRFPVLTLEALADEVIDAAVLLRYETALRPAQYQWEDWCRGQMDKIDSGLDDLEGRWFKLLSAQFHAGAISAACLLGYLDFRFAEKDWRTGRPRLTEWFNTVSKRDSMAATSPGA